MLQLKLYIFVVFNLKKKNLVTCEDKCLKSKFNFIF